MTCTDLSLYEHEDETVSSSFQDSDLDELEAYAMIFGDDEVYDDGDWIDDGASVLTCYVVWRLERKEEV